MRAFIPAFLSCLLAVSTAQAAPPLRVAASATTVDFDRAVLLGFGKQVGAEIQLAPSRSLDEALKALKAGELDVVTGLHLLGGDRPAGVSVSAEVLPTRFVAVTLGSAEPVVAIEDMRGRRIASVRGAGAARLLADAKVTHSGLAELASPQAVIEELKSDRASVGILYMEESLAMLAQARELRVGAFLGPRSSIAYAVRDPALLRSLDAFVSQMRSSPAWGMLLTQRLGPKSLELLSKARLSQ